MRFTVTTRAPLALGAALALAGMGLLAAPAQANTCPEGMAFIEGSTSICEQRFTANGNWTAPAGVTSIEVLVVGGGGGGGGANAEGNPQGNNSGGGGGGGQVRVSPVTVTPGSTYTITVGTGGANGAASANGGGGGLSRFSGPGVAAISGLGGSGGTTGGVGGNSGNDLAGGAAGGATRGAGGGAGAGQAGFTRAGGADRGGATGGNGLAPSSALFTSTTDFYGGGGGGGGMRGEVDSLDQGGLRGSSGGGGGRNGGSGNRADANADATSATDRGGGGGGGGVIQRDPAVAAFLIGAGGSGGLGVVVVRLLVGSAGATTPAAPRPTPERLALNPGDGYLCDSAFVSALPGTWVNLPASDACTRETGSGGSTLLGWATTATFPVDIAKRQVSNGWGAYEMFDANGRLTAVFIPAGGATLISGSISLYAIWGS